MKTFHYPLGHVAGITMTVGELIDKLNSYPKEMPVLAAWEGIETTFKPDHFEVSSYTMWLESEREICLIINVDQYSERRGNEP